MKKRLPLTLIFLFVWSCGNNDGIEKDNNDLKAGQQTEIPASNNNAVSASTNLLIADSFCANESKLKLLSASMLSAYAVKGNGSDLNYCGGSSDLTEADAGNFNILLTNYCMNFRGQEYILNGNIDGTVESGVNFISSIIPDVAITGNNINLSVSGRTWDGRADDMFLSLTIKDNNSDDQFFLKNVNIKKGEIDFGSFSFDNIGPYEFKFIDHFNEDLTAGLLFIYGDGEELLILTAEDGIVTVVYKQDKRDSGALLDSASCSG